MVKAHIEKAKTNNTKEGSKNLNINIVDSPGEAEFSICIFNQLVYLAKSTDPFRPLARQIDLLNKGKSFEDNMIRYLQYVVKWNHFNTITNPGKNFEEMPIKVEIQPEGKGAWYDVTDRELTLTPMPERQGLSQSGPFIWLQVFKVKVSNISSETLFVGVLQLDTAFGISSNEFDKQVIELLPGEEKYFYEYNTENPKTSYISLEPYQEVYNWKRETIRFQFIINNFSNFTNELGDFIQLPLEKPITIDTKRGGGGSFKLFQKVVKKWTTLKTTLHLTNPTYNNISGE